eukprot:196469-Rhodomonas_salina.1
MGHAVPQAYPAPFASLRLSIAGSTRRYVSTGDGRDPVGGTPGLETFASAAFFSAVSTMRHVSIAHRILRACDSNHSTGHAQCIGRDETWQGGASGGL